jgi:hypothetical protein
MVWYRANQPSGGNINFYWASITVYDATCSP